MISVSFYSCRSGTLRDVIEAGHIGMQRVHSINPPFESDAV